MLQLCCMLRKPMRACGRGGGDVCTCVLTLRGQLLWVGPVRRIHRVVQKRLHGKVEKDVDEEVEVAMELESVTASIGELQLTTTTTTT